jgi:hypothetical protein
MPDALRELAVIRQVQSLNMPRGPWIDLPEDESYAWGAALGGAIARAARIGIVTVLLDADGRAVAEIGRPQPRCSSCGAAVESGCCTDTACPLSRKDGAPGAR